ncbi:MAG: CDP-alcohol phosphatidyltransferase family protein [Elusimicrobia bacterium]|nr:CDP-alcohol phosphatidyltransferase family protein [Elusimicrobiota bacterium]
MQDKLLSPRIRPNKSWIPNVLTLGNLAFGFIVIWLALAKRDQFYENPAKFFTLLGLLLLIACACDFLDGFLARKMNVSSSLGIELDSLADLISFGVAPVIVFYICLFDETPSIYSFTACLGYLGAGAWRLARFNQSTLATRKPNAYFDGLPITGASLFWASLLLFLGQQAGNSIFEDHETGLRRVLIFLFAAIGYLMVSHFPYRSLKAPAKKSLNLGRQLTLLVILGVLVFFRFGPEVALVLVPVAYIFGTPLAIFWKKISNNEEMALRQRPL